MEGKVSIFESDPRLKQNKSINIDIDIDININTNRVDPIVDMQWKSAHKCNDCKRSNDSMNKTNEIEFISETIDR